MLSFLIWLVGTILAIKGFLRCLSVLLVRLSVLL